MIWQLLPLIALAIGVLLGFAFPMQIPVEYSKYLSVALLATLDSVFGGLKANVEETFDGLIFISGFFTNAIVAIFLVWIGERLGIDLYMVALICFGLRIFQNIASLRRYLLTV